MKQMRSVSAIVPTFNPENGLFQEVLAALFNQTLNRDAYEVVVVDNASSDRTAFERAALMWGPRLRIVREPKPGLTNARLCGLNSSTGELVVFVDDDNILAKDYLDSALTISMTRKHLGVWGGKSLPMFRKMPDVWMRHFDCAFALRDFGDVSLICESPKRTHLPLSHPQYLPIGAGMVTRREVLCCYDARIKSRQYSVLDRTGTHLSSGGDCDINLTALESGWDAGYFPELQLTHIIPASRATVSYLARVSYGSSRSWPMVLASHGICPWRPVPRWTTPIRKAKAWLATRAWRSAEDYVQWCGRCGHFDGLADVYFTAAVNGQSVS